MIIDRFIRHLSAELNLSANTVSAYRRDITDWADFTTSGKPQSLRVDDITPADIRLWLASLARKGIAMSSIRRKLQALRAFFSYLLRNDIITANPAADVDPPKLPSRLPVYIKPAETSAMLDTAIDSTEPDDFIATRDTLVIEMLYETGMRCSELINLRDSDIDTNRRELKLLGKRNKQRVVPFGHRLLQMINQYTALRDDITGSGAHPAFFVRPTGEPLYRMLVYRIVNRAMTGARVHAARLSPHVLRHSCATDMLNDGASLTAVQQILGHASLATTQVYTHVTFSDLINNYKLAHPRASKKGG